MKRAHVRAGGAMGSGGGMLPRDGGCRQDATEPGFGSRGEPCMVCDLSPLVRALTSVGWRGIAE